MNVSTPKDRPRADRVGVIDVGGGLRGAFGAGVLDRCLDEGVSFDVCLGVSAGSGNMVAYLAGQRGRNRLFYTEYPQRKEYMSVRNLVTKGSYLDLDYVYSVLSNSDGEYPLDYDALLANPAALVVVATDALAGKAVYFRKADLRRDDFGILKASSGIPVVCRPCRWEGGTYFDGGIADPVPLARAPSPRAARAWWSCSRARAPTCARSSATASPTGCCAGAFRAPPRPCAGARPVTTSGWPARRSSSAKGARSWSPPTTAAARTPSRGIRRASSACTRRATRRPAPSPRSRAAHDARDAALEGGRCGRMAGCA